MGNPIISSLKKSWRDFVEESEKFLDEQADAEGMECPMYSLFEAALGNMKTMMRFIENSIGDIAWVSCDMFQPEESGRYIVTLGSSATSLEYFSVDDNEWRDLLTGFPIDVRAWAEKPLPYPFWENEEWWKKKHGNKEHGGLIE